VLKRWDDREGGDGNSDGGQIRPTGEVIVQRFPVWQEGLALKKVKANVVICIKVGTTVWAAKPKVSKDPSN